MMREFCLNCVAFREGKLCVYKSIGDGVLGLAYSAGFLLQLLPKVPLLDWAAMRCVGLVGWSTGAGKRAGVDTDIDA